MQRRYAVHPAIGIARVGDSPDDYFVGPESPRVPPSLNRADEPPRADALYKDDHHRIKRQGARFRVYEYTQDDAARVVQVREITARDAAIEWEVHLANRKAASPRFRGRGRRNAKVAALDESRLIVDAGSQVVGGTAQAMKRLQGSFQGSSARPIEVPLGDLLTDSAGRLIVLGGFGLSPSVAPEQKITDFADNDDWCDDVSDGPVRATLRLNGSGEALVADPAWVIVAPPDFAPAIENVITLYDVVYDVMARFDRTLAVHKGTAVSFTRDIYPILRRVSNLHWVSGGAAAFHGPGKPSHFVSHLAQLSQNGPQTAGIRNRIFQKLRRPGGGGGSMPKLPAGLDPTVTVSLTREMYRRMERWASGKFEADWSGQEPPSQPLDVLPDRERPAALDRAALEACVGGGFYPGIEVGRIMLDPHTYEATRPFRIDTQLEPGRLTARMAVPWQADFRDCDFDEELGMDWWPGQRPTSVLRESGREPWVPRDWTKERMVKDWSTLGFVVQEQDPEGFVERERS